MCFIDRELFSTVTTYQLLQLQDERRLPGNKNHNLIVDY